MALIKCPECNKEISDCASNCPNCGFPVKQKLKEEEERIEKEKKRIKLMEEEKNRKEKELELKQKAKEKIQKIKSIHIFCIFFVLIVVILVTLLIVRESTYNIAIKAFETGKYKEAYEYFESSNYKNSVEYREQSLIGYTKLLIKNKNLETADEMLSLIADKTVREELQKEMIYIRAVDAYELGAFELSYELLKDIQDYSDAEQFFKNSEMMMNIQGEWNLSGKYVGYSNTKNRNYVALKINGWNSTLFYCTDGDVTYEEYGSCKLDITKIKEANLKIGTTEYIVTSRVAGNGELTLVAEIINDDFMESFSGAYVWNNFGARELLSLFKTKSGIPTKPEIGMTAEEVRNGSWGEPKEINKDTYSWGVKEQWCYSNNRYVYLENGIVIAISE